MRSIVTFEGIDEALESLHYNKRALKYKLINTIREQYGIRGDVASVKEIDTDFLVKALWDTGDDPAIIRNRRKNFNSIKSTVNADLKRLYEEGKNSEGIVINQKNIFDMSDEAKSEMLEAFSYGEDGESQMPLSKIADVLNVINDFISKDTNLEDEEKFEQLKEIIKEISGKVGITIDTSGNAPDGQQQYSKSEGIHVIHGMDREEPYEVFDEIDKIPEDELEEIPELEDVPEDKIEEEIVDKFEEDDHEELEVIDAPDDEEENEYDFTLEEILDDYDLSGYISEEEQDRARILADNFDEILSEAERYYNSYLLIPGGKYITGHTNPNGNEKKASNIKLPDFYFGKFPVTNHLFELFVEKTGYKTTAERTGYGIVYKGRYRNIIDEDTGRKTLEWSSSLESDMVKGACWFQPNGPGSSLHGKRNHPVVQVTLEDAMAFAAWTGKRLPTEEEWEAASRTSKGFNYPWGNSLKEGLCNVELSAIGDTTPVDEFEEADNQFGICDLLGNVLEWTGSRDTSSDNGTYVTKGGSWVSGQNIRLTQRFLLDARTCSNILGFRCVAYK